MSSFIVNDLTINRILTFLVNWDWGHNIKLKSAFEKEVKVFLFDDDNALQKIGQELIRLNWKATNQRYGKLSKEEDNLVRNYKYSYSPCKIQQTWYHLRCLTYQMSEGDVPETNLYKVLQDIENALANEIAHDYCESLDLEWEAKEEVIKNEM